MSNKTQDMISDSLLHMVEAADELHLASKGLREAGDKQRADRLDKIRDDFRVLRHEITDLVADEIAKSTSR